MDGAQATDLSNEPIIDGEEIARGITEWSELESPSHDAAAVNRMADRVAADCAAAGLSVERIAGEDGWGDLVIARAAGCSTVRTTSMSAPSASCIATSGPLSTSGRPSS